MHSQAIPVLQSTLTNRQTNNTSSCTVHTGGCAIVDLRQINTTILVIDHHPLVILEYLHIKSMKVTTPAIVMSISKNLYLYCSWMDVITNTSHKTEYALSGHRSPPTCNLRIFAHKSMQVATPAIVMGVSKNLHTLFIAYNHHTRRSSSIRSRTICLHATLLQRFWSLIATHL